MSKFLNFTWQDMLRASRRLFAAMTDPSDPGAEPHYHHEYAQFERPADAYIADMNGVLRYVLFPEWDRAINGTWLLEVGFKSVPDWTFPVYRFQLPVVSEVEDFFKPYNGAQCYLELAPAQNLQGGWFAIIRTVVDNPSPEITGGTASLLTSRFFRTQAEVVGLLFSLGAWPLDMSALRPDGDTEG